MVTIWSGWQRGSHRGDVPEVRLALEVKQKGELVGIQDSLNVCKTNPSECSTRTGWNQRERLRLVSFPPKPVWNENGRPIQVSKCSTKTGWNQTKRVCLMSFPQKQVRIKVKDKSHTQCLQRMKLSNFSFFATHTLVSLIFLVRVVVGRGGGEPSLFFFF